MVGYFDQCTFCRVHSIGPVNVCTIFEINQYKIDEFRKHAKLGMFYFVTCGFDEFLNIAASSYTKKELRIDMKWREMRSKVNFGHP